jgi:hypothetical protein
MPVVAARKQSPRLCLNDQALNALHPGEFSRLRRLTKGADWAANPELSHGVKAAAPCYN